MPSIIRGIALALSILPLFATDFSGKWTFDPAASNTRNIPGPQQSQILITQSDNALEFEGTYLTLDGRDSKRQVGEESRNSATKWEGSALLVNTIGSGPQNYSLVDRWHLSEDHNTLIIERQLIRATRQEEGTLVYHREGATLTPRSPQPPAAPTDIIVHSGTRIPLTLRNTIDTKHSREGDRVYLETVFPVTVANRIVIPRGSYVNGTVTTAKQAGVMKKGELYIRFDSIILPNGATRDFRSRLGSADTAKGSVDRQEGTITGERDKSGAAKGTATGAGVGAGVGGIAGAAAGHPITGLGVGAAAGAAAGLASVMLRHKPDAALPQGTTVEMVLDRDLTFAPAELKDLRR